MTGRRGFFLFLFGTTYIALGMSYIFASPEAPVRGQMSWMPVWSPLWACGILFVASGGIAVVSAWKPIPEDRFGFMALAAVAAGWTVAFLIAWRTGHFDHGWVNAIIFSTLGSAVLNVSGMPNPVSKPPRAVK